MGRGGRGSETEPPGSPKRVGGALVAMVNGIVGAVDDRDGAWSTLREAGGEGWIGGVRGRKGRGVEVEQQCERGVEVEQQ